MLDTQGVVFNARPGMHRPGWLRGMQGCQCALPAALTYNRAAWLCAAPPCLGPAHLTQVMPSACSSEYSCAAVASLTAEVTSSSTARAGRLLSRGSRGPHMGTPVAR